MFLNFFFFWLYFSYSVLIGCPEDRYGYDCNEQCNINCGVPNRCDRITGYCVGGCQLDWKGVKCDTSKFNPFFFFQLNLSIFTYLHFQVFFCDNTNKRLAL